MQLILTYDKTADLYKVTFIDSTTENTCTRNYGNLNGVIGMLQDFYADVEKKKARKKT